MDSSGSRRSGFGRGPRSEPIDDTIRQLKAEIETLRISHEAASAQMRRLDEVKTDFVTIASHELRTPLTQIRGYADILDALYENDLLDSDQVGELLDNLKRAIERMDELVAVMLDVSQLDVSALDLRLGPTVIEQVVRQAIEPAAEAIRQRRISLAARGLRGLPAIQADSQRLVQALRAVVTNAVKFTPDGGQVTITGGLGPSDSSGSPSVMLTVADTGVGIAPEHLELIFHKFFRGHDSTLHSSGAYKFMGAGPGLGLTIAKGVIEGHGGEIWAESPGYDPSACPGATITILLPTQPPDAMRRIRGLGVE